jgi:D-sedoheptulose 7-phosphate isomerase
MTALREAAPALPAAIPVGLTHLDDLGTALSLNRSGMQRTTTAWGRHLAVVLSQGQRLLVAGNGGSAAQAQHLSAEILGRYRVDRRPYSAVALHTDTSTVTAIVNDYGAEQVFQRQVAGHGRRGDVLVLMSTSGQSPNLLRAAEAGVELGLTVWAMTGPAPNPLAGRADDALCIEAHSTATIQELHLVSLHLMCAAFDVALGVSRPDPREGVG